MINDITTAATVKIKTKPTGFVKDGRPVFNAYVVSAGTIAEDDFRARVARRCGYDQAIVGAVWSATGSQAGDELLSGNRFSTGFVSGGPQVRGKFDSVDAPWDPSRHSLVPVFTAKGELRTCLAGATVENITEAPSITIKRVMDVVRHEDGVISGPAPVTVYASGTNLQVNPDAEDEAAWLEDATGRIVALATVTESTLLTLNCTFSELPPAGEYRFAVAGRAGAADGGISIGRRKVTVVEPAGTEEVQNG